MPRAAWPTSRPSVHRDDGLELRGAYITAPVRCAPPANKPTPEERDNCRPFLVRELALLPQLAGAGAARAPSASPWPASSSACGPGPASATASRSTWAEGRSIVGSYHVSQQNTFTGQLTEPMLDDVFRLALQLSEG